MILKAGSRFREVMHLNEMFPWGNWWVQDALEGLAIPVHRPICIS